MKNPRKFFPLCTPPCVMTRHKTIFHKTDEKVTVEAPMGLMRRLIKLCDGSLALDEIVNSLKNEWDESSVRSLIKELYERGVLVDRRFVSDSVWKVIENPSRFPMLITDAEVALLVEQARYRHEKDSVNTFEVQPSPLGELLERRRSIRSFSDETVYLESIINMLWSAYGEAIDGRRTVPSAGALYPLVIHLALLKQVDNLSSAVYRVCLGSRRSVGFDLVSRDTNQFIRAFADPLMLENAGGVIVISGSFRVSGEKYGNRSMLYVPLEAGHAAQNVHLSAVEHGVATVEIGGFVEELLSKAIDLPKNYRPLTSIVFGREGNVPPVDISEKNPEVHWAVPLVEGYRLPFTMVFARMSSENKEDLACGRAVAPRLAYTKAVAEAREWAACGCVPKTLTKARFAELETAVDPRDVIRFHPAQYRLNRFPFKPFENKREYAWIEGKNELNGKRVYLLADLVYFPYYPKSPQYAHANSSGVAAHPSREQAIQNGVLELVERDSFMVAYLTKLAFPTVSEQTLPENIRLRILELKRSGFRVWVKDYSLDLASVVFVFAQSEQLNFTTCAGCSRFNADEALDHALMEVESSVLCRLANGPLKPITPSKVRFPSDHGRLYEHRQFFRKANFLVDGREIISFRDIGKGVAVSWQDLLDRLADKNWPIITVMLDLSEDLGGNDGLHIVRSVVPGMVPISFGFREEPCGMERIRMVAKEFGSLSVSYRSMPKFPHPYT